jgi:hypothetical protein
MIYALVDELKDASDDYLGWGSDFGKARHLLDEIRTYLPGITLALVVDEAQNIAHMYSQAFRDASASISRSAMRELDSILVGNGYVIYSGTGLTEKAVEDNTGSNAARIVPSSTRTCSHTKAFDSRDAQSAYISKYLLPRLKNSPSGKLLLDRAWDWLRGRYFPVPMHMTFANISPQASFHCVFRWMPDFEFLSLSSQIIE